MNERIHACLDGEISRDDLSPAERAELAEMERTLHPAVEHLSTLPAPELTGRVMAALPARIPAPVSAPAPWRAALDWLWRPRSFQLTLRPAYALAAVALLAVALPRPGELRAPASPAAPLAGSGQPAPVYVQFRLEAEGASQVAVAGTFTGWEPRHVLRETEPGVWSALIPLQPGVHDYAFVVDGTEWVPDPHAPQVADSFGGTNSRISLPPLASA